jgi:hypothetical protein
MAMPGEVVGVRVSGRGVRRYWGGLWGGFGFGEDWVVDVSAEALL